MRILMMIDWNRGRGGAEAHALLLRDGLRRAGDEVRLLTSSAGTAGDGTAEYVAFGTENRAAQALLQIANPFAVAEVRRALREFRPDVAWINMFAWHLSPAAVLALGSLPKVLMVSDYKLDCPIGSKLLPDGSLCESRPGWVCRREGCVGLVHWLRDQPRYALIRRAVEGASRVVACSQWVANRLRDAGLTAETVHLPVVAPGPEFHRRPAAEPSFLYCGRLEREKGVDHLIRAFARLRMEFPTARLRIAGTGSWRDRLGRDAADAVDFLGWRTPDQIESELAKTWASVVPSVWAEPQGLVAVEAIIRGVPVIASAAGGLAEIVEHGRGGLLYRRGDDDALLACLRVIAGGAAFPGGSLDKDAAGEAAARFSVEHHVGKMRRIFDEALTGKPVKGLSREGVHPRD